MVELDKTGKIRKEEKRLLKIFKTLDANKLAVAKTLIARAAYITISLEELEESLNGTGWVEEYQNGETQKGMKKSAAADVHISLTKNLTAISKQLLDLVPPAEKRSKLKELFNE